MHDRSDFHTNLQNSYNRRIRDIFEMYEKILLHVFHCHARRFTSFCPKEDLPEFRFFDELFEEIGKSSSSTGKKTINCFFPNIMRKKKFDLFSKTGICTLYLRSCRICFEIRKIRKNSMKLS
jgi:hypothetical protein